MQEGTKQQILEADVIQLIIFNLGEEEFGVRIDEIREIIETKDITSIPDSPEFIKGLTNVRGEIVAAIDLRARFFLIEEKDYESKHIIITEQEKNLFGVMVDEVTEVMRLPEANIKMAPDIITRMNRKYVNGLITLEDRLIILLDLKKVLSEEELIKLSEINRRHFKKIEGEKSEDIKKGKFIERDMEEAEKKTDKKSEGSREKGAKKGERGNL